MNIEQMKQKASELIENSDFSWFDSVGNLMSIGIDWMADNNMVIIDMEHPDGPVIQAVGEIDYVTIYTDGEDN